MKSGSASKYPVLSVEQICNIPIREIADNDAALFLWVPTPLLDQGFVVLKAWGFKYKTTLYWHKIGRKGLGFWFSGDVENCLLAIRGKIKAFRCQKSNLVAVTPQEHSRKPAEITNLIEPYCPEPRLEVFCRGTPRPGWYGWGNECNSSVRIAAFDYLMSKQ